MPTDDWVEELRAQLENHDRIIISLTDDASAGDLGVQNVSYDGALDAVVIEVM